jgi:hypothetical protein
MQTDVLGRAMREATAELGPPPDFTSRVVRRGRRRQVRRRASLVAGLAVLAVLAGMPAVGGWPGSTGNDVSADPRLAEPTRGDLAGDRQFMNTVVRAWRAGMPVSPNDSRGLFNDLRGQAHVYWAGTTPAGRAAVVLQQAYLHSHGNLSPEDANQMQTLVGLVAVDPKDGGLKLVTDQYRADGEPAPGYFQFGPGDRTILVVDRGRPLYFSPAPVNRSDGRVVRDWAQMSIVDGVAMTELPEGTAPADARVLVRDRRPAPDDKSRDGLLYLEPASQYLDFADKLRRGETFSLGSSLEERRLQWRQPEGPVLVGQSPQMPPGWSAAFNQALEEYGMLDLGVDAQAWGLWNVLAGLPDGRTAIVSELMQGQHPSRLYAVLLDRAGEVQAVQAGDVVDTKAVLPVAMRMPDGQGWVVAAYGSHLRYRTANGGQWVDGGDNAALLPDRAADVQVNRPGQGPAVVTLPR